MSSIVSLVPTVAKTQLAALHLTSIIVNGNIEILARASISLIEAKSEVGTIKGQISGGVNGESVVGILRGVTVAEVPGLGPVL